jgi:hypothetical protein
MAFPHEDPLPGSRLKAWFILSTRAPWFKALRATDYISGKQAGTGLGESEASCALAA